MKFKDLIIEFSGMINEGMIIKRAIFFPGKGIFNVGDGEDHFVSLVKSYSENPKRFANILSNEVKQILINLKNETNKENIYKQLNGPLSAEGVVKIEFFPNQLLGVYGKVIKYLKEVKDKPIIFSDVKNENVKSVQVHPNYIPSDNDKIYTGNGLKDICENKIGIK